MIKRFSLLLGFVIAIAVTKIPVRSFTNRDGVSRDPSVWALFFPNVDAYRYSVIKSTQTGSCALSSLPCTITISAVTTANTIVSPIGVKDTGANALISTAVDYQLASTTTISVHSDQARSTITVGAEATEYYGNVFTSNGVQRGTIVIAGSSSSNTASITALTGGKGNVIGCGSYVSAGSPTTNDQIAALLSLSGTTVTATRSISPAGIAMTVCYQVPDWR